MSRQQLTGIFQLESFTSEDREDDIRILCFCFCRMIVPPSAADSEGPQSPQPSAWSCPHPFPIVPMSPLHLVPSWEAQPSIYDVSVVANELGLARLSHVVKTLRTAIQAITEANSLSSSLSCQHGLIIMSRTLHLAACGLGTTAHILSCTDSLTWEQGLLKAKKCVKYKFPEVLIKAKKEGVAGPHLSTSNNCVFTVNYCYKIAKKKHVLWLLGVMILPFLTGDWHPCLSNDSRPPQAVEKESSGFSARSLNLNLTGKRWLPNRTKSAIINYDVVIFILTYLTGNDRDMKRTWLKTSDAACH